MFQSLRQNS
jgi:hypothetical protein